MSFALIIISSALINNLVLTQFLGLCPFFGVSKKLSASAGMGIAVVFVMTVSSAASNLIYNLLLVRFDIRYLHLIAFILTIASLVQFLDIMLKKTSPALYSSLGIFLPLMTTNCMILGVAISNMAGDHGFLDAVAHGVGGGLGFFIAIVVFSGLRTRMDRCKDVPKVFQGFPIALVAAGLMSLVFIGFHGLFSL